MLNRDIFLLVGKIKKFTAKRVLNIPKISLVRIPYTPLAKVSLVCHFLAHPVSLNTVRSVYQDPVVTSLKAKCKL